MRDDLVVRSHRFQSASGVYAKTDFSGGCVNVRSVVYVIEELEIVVI